MKHFVSWTLCCFSLAEKICSQPGEYEALVSAVSQEHPRLFQVQPLFNTQRILSAYYAQLRPQVVRTRLPNTETHPVLFSRLDAKEGLSENEDLKTLANNFKNAK